MNGRAICFTMGQCIVFAIIVTGIIGETCNKANKEIDGQCNDQKKLSDIMWTASSETADKAYDTPFVKQLIAGTLDPTKFGAYIVQDAVYLEKQSDALTNAWNEMVNTNTVLGMVLKEKAKKYREYATDMYNVWQLSDSSCVKLNSACEDYTDYKIFIAKTYDPKYSIVAMIPCLKLWPWIGTQITNEESGLYAEWVKKNFNPDHRGYEDYEKMVDGWYKEKLIDKDVATRIYKRCMNGEYEFFNSITK